MENFHPELAVSVKSVLENPELAVCRAVSSVSVWKVHFLREYQFSIGKILLFKEKKKKSIPDICKFFYTHTF